MEQILIYATVLAPIVMGLVQVMKSFCSGCSRLIPMISIVIGLCIGFMYGLTVTGETILYTWAGLLSGMSAVGVYEITKK